MKKLATLLLALLLFTTTVYASSAIQAVLSDDISVKLNGSTLTLKDANGNPVYPISYNGTTYLPVRAVAENLDLDVKWDGNTKTVELQKNTFGLNEWWEVKNEWKLKINSVKITNERSEYSSKDPQEVVIIDYTYENLGYTRFDGNLRIEPKTVADDNNKTGDGYFLNLKNKPKNAKIGEQQKNVQVDFGLPIAGSENLTIYFSEYGSPYTQNGEDYMDTHKATFIVPIVR